TSFLQMIQFQFFHSILKVLHFFTFLVQALAYTYHRICLKFMLITYHHNRNPQLIRNDVSQLSKLPNHIACILDLKENEVGGGFEGLIDQTSDLAAWSIGANIPTLSIYERSGCMKECIPQICQAVNDKLELYFGAGECPPFKLYLPHTGTAYDNLGEVIHRPSSGTTDRNRYYALQINMLSEEDGREGLVDLTKTLARLAHAKRIRAKEITIEVVDREMKNSVTGEPDLLVLFGPMVNLQAFPPWQIRLSEIYYHPDNNEVSYGIFLKALEKYSNCKINVG
ncbi:Undecaprenyl diphosphate synthase, partial [Nadsonia fulvescens var. elongata DSM 6958]